MRSSNRPHRLVAGTALVLASTLTVLGCIGRATRRDERTLRESCRVHSTGDIDEVQARCVAKVYGVLDTAACPMEVAHAERRGEPVFRVRETCTGLGVEIDRSTGEVLAVIQGDRILRE